MTARPVLSRFLTGVVFAAWICALWVLLEEARYATFLRAQMWPLLDMGLLLLIGYLWALLRGAGEHDEPVSLGAVLTRGGWLVLPLVYAMFCAGQTLGGYAFQKRSLDLGSVPSSIEVTVPNGPRGTAQVTLIDIHRRADSMLGRRVVAEGFVHHEKGLPEGTFIAFRFLIYCCAADAQPVGVLTKYARQDALPEETWVRIEGTVQMTKLGGKACPTINAEAVTVTQPPKYPYLY